MIGSTGCLVTTTRHDSALGTWSMHAYAAGTGEPFAALLEGIWDFEGTTTYRRERIFPTGRYELVVQLGEPHRPIEGETFAHAFAAACISGIQTGPRVIEAPHGVLRVLGIRLTPLGAFAAFGVPLDELAGHSTIAQSVLGGRATRELEQQLHAAANGTARVRCAYDWVAARLLRAPYADPAIAWAAGRIDAGDTGALSSLHVQAGRGKTAFVAAFRRQTGVTPKLFAELVRIRTALQRLHRAANTLGDTANFAGYYDQPHMTAEFRRFTGLTPGQYAASLQYEASTSVAEEVPG